MYINSFLTELNKKIDTVDVQLKEFESKMDKINEVKNMLTKKTLKDIDELCGEDLVLLDKEEFVKILKTFDFDKKEEKMKHFFEASVSIKVYQRLISDGEIEVDNQDVVFSYIKWLDEQAKYIKEYIKDFNRNNKEYYNSLKESDSLYRKYLGYFNGDKLVKPIKDIDEFDELLKKSGIIASEKWQILKYVGEKNMTFKDKKVKDDEKQEYGDEEVMTFVSNILSREKKLINSITDSLLKKSLEFLDYDDKKIDSVKLTSEEIIEYQKIPILDTMNKLYTETKDMLVEDKDEDAKKIEGNIKDLLKLVDSYDVIRKIEG